MQGEMPHPLDREGREMRRAYDQRKAIELGLKIANEYRLSKTRLSFRQWLASVALPTPEFIAERLTERVTSEGEVTDDD